MTAASVGPAIARRSGSLTAPVAWLVLLVAALTAYRLAVIVSTDLPLFFDEAYYRWWSQDLAFGYYSKPPMVAWLIALTTSLFGQAELAVKLASPILYAFTAFVVAAIVRHGADERTAAIAGALFVTAPLVGFNALFITTDAPLLFCWALAVLAFQRAVVTDRWAWWLACGIAGGLGMLSKYTLGVLPLGLAAFLLLRRDQRRRLRGPRALAGAAVAFAIWLPNLAWNAAHGFVSFRHTAEISQLAGPLIHPDRLLEFWAGQFVAAGPITLAAALALARRPADGGLSLARWVAFPILAVISLQAFLAKANVNWAAPALVGLCVLAAHGLARRPRWLAAALASNVLLLAVFYHYHALTGVLSIERTARNDPYHRVLGWRELGAAVSPLFARYPEARLAGDSRKVLSYLSYYTQPRQEDPVVLNRTGRIRHHYDLVADVADAPAGRFLFVSVDEAPDLSLWFAEVEPLGRVAVPIYADEERAVHAYLVSGFRGD